MTQNEIVEIANQAELCQCIWVDDEGPEIASLVAFAKLVEERTAAKATDEANARANSSWTLMCKKMVEAEREACATVCDDLYRVWTLTDEYDIDPPDAIDCKRAIRARGEA